MTKPDRALGFILIAGSILTAAIVAKALAEDRTTMDGAAPGIAQLPAPVNDADYYEAGPRAEARFELGQALFFDKILSGNRNISCATCHHPDFGSGDGLALSLGEGALATGPDRNVAGDEATAVHGRIPRNAPALFNVGAVEFERLFHDGRVETDPNGYYEGGFITPAKWKLPSGLESVLAAQAMFPIGSSMEMAGQQGENEVADAVALGRMAGPHGAWERLAARLRDVPEYVTLFEAAFPEQVAEAKDIDFVLAANAIAAFETVAFRADRSAFDRYLNGETAALSEDATHGMELFYGKADCSRCHSGKFQTDHEFHAIAMPQIGPGKGDGNDGSYWRASGHSAFVEDHGRGRVTGRDEDDFKFRTPSLRNVELTGPWGHAGSYATLEDVVRHHLDPVGSLEEYDPEMAVLPEIGRIAETTATGSKLDQEEMSPVRQAGFMLRDTWVQQSPPLRGRIAEANQLQPVSLSDEEVASLVAFLRSLTDEGSRSVSALVPLTVPSGLPVED